MTARVRLELLGERIRPSRHSVVRRHVLKRGFDILGAVLLVVLLAPLLLVLTLLVRATSPGPALFRQTRVGRGERTFVILKFRTMFVGTTDESHRQYVSALLNGEPIEAGVDGLYKLDADPRTTRLGRWLRRTSLDELPQLFNVVLGHMSLVGPRPVLPYEAALLNEEQRLRFAVRPGMTGLWQVSGRSLISFPEQLLLDTRYVQEQSLWLDLVILLRTLPAVLSGGTR